MSSKLLDAHIEVNPGFAGGEPHIAGHRIKVRDIAVWHEQPEFPQDPSRVAAALRWYGAGALEPGNTPA